MKPLFKLDGLNWASVEHYYQASKHYDSGDDDFYRSFLILMSYLRTLMAKSAGGKTGKYVGKRIPAELKIKDGFFDNKYCEKIMNEHKRPNMNRMKK